MKVWEAIEMLQGMDGNKEVTVTVGKNKPAKRDEFISYPTFPYQPQPNWVIGKEYWPSNTVTCKLQ